MRKMVLAATAVGVAFAGLAMTSCSDEVLEPQAVASRADTQPTDEDYAMEIIQSVSGNAHSPDGEVRQITRTINIVKYEDGTVEGWYHARGRNTSGAHIRVQIDCLHVNGNQAWASGAVVAAVNPDNIGRPYSIRVIDHGEGANAAPDEFGGTRFMYYDCVTEPDLPVWDLTIGNIVVRGGDGGPLVE